jgi:chromate transporter
MAGKDALEIGEVAATPIITKLTFWRLLGIWVIIGIQSFGGGASTVFLIRDRFITRLGLITHEDYTRMWVLCQLTPGVNLISLTILIGKKAGGAAGIAASLFGLLIPSTTITILLAAGFSSIQGWPPIQAMLRGITPATAGISAYVAIQYAIPLLKVASGEGKASLLLSLLIIVLCALLVGALKLPVVLVLISAAGVGAIGFSLIWKRG